jgi:hypothetical protein
MSRSDLYRRWQYATCAAALAIGLTASPGPAPLPTPHFEPHVVDVQGVGRCVCWTWETWRRWHPDRPDERQEMPLNCSCPGVR